jgi:hypothetical protein
MVSFCRVLPDNCQIFDRPLRRQLTSARHQTCTTCSGRDPLRFPLDLDLDLGIVPEIFKVKVKTLTSIISTTVARMTFAFDSNIVLDDLYQSPEGPGRGPHRGAARPPQSLDFDRFFLVKIEIKVVYFHICYWPSVPL